MKKNFTLNAVFVFTMIMIASFAGNVFAGTTKTCGAPNKTTLTYAPVVSTNVVINEVYGGSETGGVYNADFIELYNQSATAVNISDWSVQYYTEGQINGGAPTSTAHIPDGATIAGNGFFIIRVSPIRGIGAALPCEDLNAFASFAETGILSAGGKLVLTSTGADLPDCTSSLNVVDRVGWGVLPAFVCNETANAGVPTVSTSVQRRGGEFDTDNNLADFTILASTPTPAERFFAPTAATVSISGRVTNARSRRGISRALITMTDGTGVSRMTYTNLSGHYNFTEVEVGQTLIFSIKAKRYNFSEPTKVVSLTEELTTLDFTAY